MNPKGRYLRKGRFSEPGRVYLVTTTTHGRAPLFEELHLARLVVASLRSAEPHAHTLCYCLMPDHLHWLLQLHEGATLSTVVQGAKSVSAHRIRKVAAHVERVWQAGFHDRALREEEDLAAVARYVIANPLRAGLTPRVGAYPHWDAVWI
jgi:putative transposase